MTVVLFRCPSCLNFGQLDIGMRRKYIGLQCGFESCDGNHTVCSCIFTNNNMSPLLNIFKASHRDVNFILYCLFLIHLLFVLLYALFFVFSPFTGLFVFLCNSRSLRKKVAYFLLAFKERKILYQRFLFLKMFRMFGHKN